MDALLRQIAKGLVRIALCFYVLLTEVTEDVFAEWAFNKSAKLLSVIPMFSSACNLSIECVNNKAVLDDRLVTIPSPEK